MATRVYLGLGTNQGDKANNLTRAIDALSLALGRCTDVSAFIETAPWGFESENSFLNCAAAFETELSPLELLNATERIERELGRTQKSAGGIYHDRIIDIDILLYGNLVVESPRLTIPHPLMHKRTFVLEPLAEIAPDTIHPTTGKGIRELLKELRKDEPIITKG